MGKLRQVNEAALIGSSPKSDLSLVNGMILCPNLFLQRADIVVSSDVRGSWLSLTKGSLAAQEPDL